MKKAILSFILFCSIALTTTPSHAFFDDEVCTSTLLALRAAAAPAYWYAIKIISGQIAIEQSPQKIREGKWLFIMAVFFGLQNSYRFFNCAYQQYIASE